MVDSVYILGLTSTYAQQLLHRLLLIRLPQRKERRTLRFFTHLEDALFYAERLASFGKKEIRRWFLYRFPGPIRGRLLTRPWGEIDILFSKNMGGPRIKLM